MRQRWKKGVLAAVTIMLFFCSGCATTELEERCFPLLVAAGMEGKKVTFKVAFPKSDTTGVENSSAEETFLPFTEEKSFEKSKKEYEARLNKFADYNHLKVFVIDTDLLKQSEAYAKMLDYLAKTESFPRNTYVCAMEDVDKLFETQAELSQDLGTYLEAFIDKHEQAKSHILTLGDLLDEKENQTMILYMPYLKAEKKYVNWEGYINTLGEVIPIY